MYEIRTSQAATLIRRSGVILGAPVSLAVSLMLIAALLFSAAAFCALGALISAGVTEVFAKRRDRGDSAGAG